MKPDRKKLFNFVNHFDAVNKFSAIRPDLINLEEVFENNYKVWLIYNSDKKEAQEGEIVIENGRLVNARESIKTNNLRNGWQIDQVKFINEELMFLDNSIMDDHLSYTEERQLEVYKNFLYSKKQNK